jgi:hypothetical protein
MLRRKLRDVGSPISFFAFQDIITSVSGILIIVTLLLALQLGDTSAALEDERATADQQTRLAALLDELSTLRRAGERASAERGGRASAQELAARAARIREDARAIAERNARLRADAAGITADASAERRAAMLVKLSASTAPRRSEIEKLEAQAAKLAAEAEAAARAAEAAQAAVMAEQQRRNVLRLIPEPSATNREPVIVQVGAGRWTVQRFDVADKTDGTTLADFRTALGRFDSLKHYLVYYGKPSASDDFDAFVDAGRSAGYAVGYDLVPEGTEIELHKK